MAGVFHFHLPRRRRNLRRSRGRVHLAAAPASLAISPCEMPWYYRLPCPFSCFSSPWFVNVCYITEKFIFSEQSSIVIHYFSWDKQR